MNKEKHNMKTMSMVLAFSAMSEMLDSPKKIDELKKLPAYVKDGEVFDFNGRSFGETAMPDCEIFDTKRVMGAQAVTQALRVKYIKSLNEWLAIEDAVETGETSKKEAKKNTKKMVDESVEVKGEEPSFDLLAEIEGHINDGKLKKAKKLLAENEDDANYKKAKKLIKKAKDA